jgi:pilus assembly protein Flp/PilA
LTRQLVVTPLDCTGVDRHLTKIRDLLSPAPEPSLPVPVQGCFLTLAYKKAGPCSQLLHMSGRTVPAMITLIRKFWADETAATAIEYGLIAAGISLAIIAAVNGIGAKLNTKFSSINTSLK